jgi:hypothetical protein
VAKFPFNTSLLCSIRCSVAKPTPAASARGQKSTRLSSPLLDRALARSFSLRMHYSLADAHQSRCPKWFRNDAFTVFVPCPLLTQQQPSCHSHINLHTGLRNWSGGLQDSFWAAVLMWRCWKSTSDALDAVMTKVPMSHATPGIKAHLAEVILQAAAQGMTSYDGLVAAASDQIQTIISISPDWKK